MNKTAIIRAHEAMKEALLAERQRKAEAKGFIHSK